MLPRRERLSTEEFMEVMKNGRVFHSPLFLMRAIQNASSTKFAAVASKKVAKTAVLRNKIQRHIYISLQSLIKNVIPGTRAILFPKEAALSKDKSVMTEEIQRLFVKAGIIK
jgi:ribonuclease P protein component